MIHCKALSLSQSIFFLHGSVEMRFLLIANPQLGFPLDFAVYSDLFLRHPEAT